MKFLKSPIFSCFFSLFPIRLDNVREREKNNDKPTSRISDVLAGQRGVVIWGSPSMLRLLAPSSVGGLSTFAVNSKNCSWF